MYRYTVYNIRRVEKINNRRCEVFEERCNGILYRLLVE